MAWAIAIPVEKTDATKAGRLCNKSVSRECDEVITLTSTYDHRIIQGAESGLFLKKVHELLLGEDGFYDSLFADMAVPYEAVKWRIDHGASDSEDSLTGAVAKQMAVNTLINQYRVRGHLIANTDPEFTDHVLDKMDTDEFRMMPFNSPAGAELYVYAKELMEKKRASGDTSGMLDMIMAPGPDGSVMSETEFRNFFCLLVAAGNDTTR